jgi:signal transduction histidine kinase
MGSLEAKFLLWLRRRRFDRKQSKALAAITFGAAAKLLAQKKSLPDFFEQVEYCGRRLAKLDVAPGAVIEALAAYDRLLAGGAGTFEARDADDLRWVCEQLNFCVVLTLNSAFYQVREAETEAFFELHDAELNAAGEGELMQAGLAALARFCRADAACAVLFDPDGGQAVAAGVAPPPPGSFLSRRFASPALLRPASGDGRKLLDPTWRGRYASVWSVPLGTCGAMQFGFRKDYEWLPREQRLLAAAAERSVRAAEKVRLTGQLAAREREVRELAARMLEVEERERRRISRELHDETAQSLSYLRLHLEMLARLAPETLPALRNGLAEAGELTSNTIREIRRVLSDLSPAVLDQLGLAAAVRQLLHRLREVHGLSIRLNVEKLGPLPAKTAIVVYRLVQECCANAARHSSARHLNVFLGAADGRVSMRIADDGIGFRMEEALVKPGSYGLAGMRERVALAGGELQVSSVPGRGTRVSAAIPFSAMASAADAKTVRLRRRAQRTHES